MSFGFSECNRFKSITVNSELFVRTLFSRNFTFHDLWSFVKIKPWVNGKITLSFIDIGKSFLSLEFFTSLIYNAIGENKILVKISESTVII